MHRAAKQLLRDFTCNLHRPQYLLMNVLDSSAASANLRQFELYRLAIISRSSSLSVFWSCIHLCPIIRCYSHGCHFSSLVAADAPDGSLFSDCTSGSDDHENNICPESIKDEAVKLNTNLVSSDCTRASSSDIKNLHVTSPTGEEMVGSPSIQVAVGLEQMPSALYCTLPAEDRTRDDLGKLACVGSGILLLEPSSCSEVMPTVMSNKDRADKASDVSSYVRVDTRLGLNERNNVESSQKILGHASEMSVDASTFSSILDEHGWSPYTESMLQSYTGRLTPELVAEVVDSQKNAKVAFSFLEWAGNQDKYEHRVETFTKVIGRLGKDMHFKAAWRVLEFMKKHGLKVDYAFSIFVHRLKNANMVEEIVEAISRMDSLEVVPTVPLYTLAFQLILKAQKFDEAERLYKQLREVGLQPDTKLYGVLISGFGRAGQVDNALLFFKEMQRKGVPPDRFSYIGLIRALATGGQLDEGQKYLREMMHNNCLPKGFSRLDLDCALHGLSSMEGVHKFLEDLKARGHLITIYTYNNMLQYLVANKMLHGAFEVFDRMSAAAQACKDHSLSLNKTPVAVPNGDSYGILIQGLCHGGKLDKAARFFKQMLVKELKPTAETCNCLLHGLSSNTGFLYEAMELSRYMAIAKLTVNLEVQKMFFGALVACGQLWKACTMFENMKRRGCIDQSSKFDALVHAGS